KEIITNLSDDFIKVLHSEFAGELEKNLSEQKSATIEIIKEKATMDSEIRLAGKQQNKNLQQTLPEGDERIHFSVWYSPLMTVGGDYYRVIRLDDNEYALFLADISGHGIGAAMHINTLRLGFDENLHYKDKPEKLLRKLSDYLYGKIGDNFVTAIYVHINLKRKIIRYCNAGHPKAFLYELVDGQKGARFLRPTGKVLGLFQKSHFRDTEISISPKERLVLYTDGISESFNKSKQMLGERGLLRALTGSNNLSPEATIEKVKNFLLTFQKEMVVEDDRCLILTDLFANIN
ncbi:MAG: serine/threonine-protein phosphatase, partial [Leptospira sp.]|nr:serine/threonine-protein phosphatase [Leptospira sp.]